MPGAIRGEHEQCTRPGRRSSAHSAREFRKVRTYRVSVGELHDVSLLADSHEPIIATQNFDVLKEIAVGCSSDRCLVSTWRDAELAHEGAGHVALVCEAREMRRIGRRSACREVPADKPNSELNEISVRCRSHFAEESSQELEPADVG
jgi:hypothetical protein